MNCKPGDLAIVVGGYRRFLGRILRVTGIDADFSDSWNTEPEVFHRDCLIVFRDEILRPVSGLPDTADTNTEQPIKEVA